MPDVKIKVSEKDVQALEQRFFKLGYRFDEEVNNFMHTYKERFYKDVLENMPISGKHPRGGTSAKKNPLSIKRGDLYLGFFNRTDTIRTVKNWREYGYLIFPEEGRGHRSPRAYRFFEKATKKNEPIVYQELFKVLDRVIKEQGL